MGDGTQTSYRPQVDVREAISVLRNMGIALITVPFGREGDTFVARDVSIEQLPQQYRVFSGNDVSIDCLARLKGVANRPLRVQLLLKSENENMVVQETLEIVADNADAMVPVRFQWTAKTPGQYQIAVKIEAVDGELLLQNNTQTAFLTVLEGGLRVLYFYGNRLGEQLELRRSLGSSPDIELLESYIRHGKDSRWPDPRTSAVLDGEFDLIIIEDVHARAFGEVNLQAIADAVEQGKGLMMVGGYYSFGPGGYRQTPVDAALPIEMEIFEKQEIGVENPIRKMFHLDREVAMRPTGSHPVTIEVKHLSNRILDTNFLLLKYFHFNRQGGIHWSLTITARTKTIIPTNHHQSFSLFYRIRNRLQIHLSKCSGMNIFNNNQIKLTI
jgi:hypothetical protein